MRHRPISLGRCLSLALSLLVFGACTSEPTPEQTLDMAAAALNSADEGAIRVYANTDSIIGRLAVEMSKAVAARNPLAGLFGGMTTNTTENMLREQYADALRRLRENAKLTAPKTNTATLFGDSSRFNGFGKTAINGDLATVEVRLTVSEKGQLKPLVLLVELTRQNKAWRITALPNLMEALLSKS